MEFTTYECIYWYDAWSILTQWMPVSNRMNPTSSSGPSQASQQASTVVCVLRNRLPGGAGSACTARRPRSIATRGCRAPGSAGRCLAPRLSSIVHQPPISINFIVWVPTGNCTTHLSNTRAPARPINGASSARAGVARQAGHLQKPSNLPPMRSALGSCWGNWQGGTRRQRLTCDLWSGQRLFGAVATPLLACR